MFSGGNAHLCRVSWLRGPRFAKFNCCRAESRGWALFSPQNGLPPPCLVSARCGAVASYCHPRKRPCHPFEPVQMVICSPHHPSEWLEFISTLLISSSTSWKFLPMLLRLPPLQFCSLGSAWPRDLWKRFGAIWWRSCL